MKVLVVQFEFECEDFNQVMSYFSQGNYCFCLINLLFQRNDNFVQLIVCFSQVKYNFDQINNYVIDSQVNYNFVLVNKDFN